MFMALTRCKAWLPRGLLAGGEAMIRPPHQEANVFSLLESKLPVLLVFRRSELLSCLIWMRHVSKCILPDESGTL